MQKRHNDTRFRDFRKSRWSQGFWFTIVGKHGSTIGVPNRFPDPGLPRPALLPCTKMSVLGDTQVTHKFSTRLSLFSFCYYIEYYNNRRCCRCCRVSRLLLGNKKRSHVSMSSPGRIFSRRELSNVCKVFLSSLKTRGSDANGYHASASVFTFPDVSSNAT